MIFEGSLSREREPPCLHHVRNLVKETDPSIFSKGFMAIAVHYINKLIGLCVQPGNSTRENLNISVKLHEKKQLKKSHLWCSQNSKKIRSHESRNLYVVSQTPRALPSWETNL